MTKLLKVLGCPFAIFGGLILISIGSLAAAFIGEIFFGLEPCQLCIYQRWPFAIVIAFGLLGLAMRKNATTRTIIVSFCGFTMLTNSGIALYHTGVEQKWWTSAIGGCSVPPLNIEEQDWLENIMSAPAKPCDVISWQDPILGLSMANLNVMLGAFLFIICMISATRLKHKENNKF